MFVPVILWGAAPKSIPQIQGCTDPQRGLPLIATRVKISASNLTPRVEPAPLAEVEKKLARYLWEGASSTEELQFLDWLPGYCLGTRTPAAVLEAEFTDYKQAADVWLTFAIHIGNKSPIPLPRKLDVRVFDADHVMPPGNNGMRWLYAFPQKLREALTANEKIREWLASSLGYSVALTEEDKFFPSDASRRLWLPLLKTNLEAAANTQMKVAFQVGDHGAGLHVTIPSQVSKVNDPKGWENNVQVMMTENEKLEAAYPYDNYTQWSQIASLFRRRTQGQTSVYMEKYFGGFRGTDGPKDRHP